MHGESLITTPFCMHVGMIWQSKKFLIWLLEIIGVEVQSTVLSVDPVLVFSNGQKLEVFSTDTFEPWVMHLPSGEVFVASPADQIASTK